jgi:hypothetical protein
MILSMAIRVNFKSILSMDNLNVIPTWLANCIIYGKN